MPTSPSRSNAPPSPAVPPGGAPPVELKQPFDPSVPTLDGAWYDRRKQLAHALQHQLPAKLSAGLAALPSATWPRWDPERAWAMLDPDAQQRLERMGPHAAHTVPVPHDLLACLMMNSGWQADPGDAALNAVLDRLIAEGEPLDRCAATPPEHSWVIWTSPLYRAASLGLDAVVVRLLDAGASPNVPILHEQAGVTTAGATVLYMAVQKSSLPTVERLLLAGASVNPPDSEAPTPRGQMKGYGPLHAAALRYPSSNDEVIESRAILDRLVQAGSPVNALADDVDGPLHAAVMRGHPALVEHLIALGADPYRRNGGGESPWEAAQRFEQRWLGQAPKNTMETTVKARVLAIASVLRKTVVAHEGQALRTTLTMSTVSTSRVEPVALDDASGRGGTPPRRRL